MVKVLRRGSSVWFWCPGCACRHRVTLPEWVLTGGDDRPTITPSLITNPDGPRRCHLLVEGGRITYLADSHHHLAGQAVEMEDLQ